jgi:dephospho-CoA kinase
MSDNQLSKIEISDYIQEFLKFKGMETLNPPQLDSIPYLVNTEKSRSLVVSAPTGSGKTLIVSVAQSLPNIQIEQYKPTLRFPVEMPNEPTTPLGKVCVVLKNGPPPSNRNDRWNAKLIRERVERHQWDSGGVEDAIQQLIRWEILQPKAQYLRFYPDRVEVIEKKL